MIPVVVEHHCVDRVRLWKLTLRTHLSSNLSLVVHVMNICKITIFFAKKKIEVFQRFIFRTLFDSRRAGLLEKKIVSLYSRRKIDLFEHMEMEKNRKLVIYGKTIDASAMKNSFHGIKNLFFFTF